ncbi:UNVERIFIED_CONTAM: hypothetical protein GTU68_031395 [Idotea baltica]|nr:hypothetical protein [Idotea baltica]
MSLSEKLSELNYNRYKSFSLPFNKKNSKQAILAFTGDVYTDIDTDNYREKDFEYAQNHLRIISGLYGLLRPLDLIQPYRLEMKTKLKIGSNKDLYSFWGNKLTKQVSKDLEKQNDKIIINLASNEYFSAINPKEVDSNLITPIFKEKKGSDYKIIAIYAKRARGLMTNYIIKNRIKNITQLKKFDLDNYSFNKSLSNDNDLVFTRG